MNSLSENLQAIPHGALAASIMMLVIGLVVWAAGRRVLKPAFASLAALGGAAAGWTFGVRFDLGVPPWIESIILALLFACFAIVAYRAMVAMGMAVILAMIAPLALFGGAQLQDYGVPQHEEIAPVPTESPESPKNSTSALESDQSPLDDDLDSWWVKDSPVDEDNTDDDPKTAGGALEDALSGFSPFGNLIPIEPDLPEGVDQTLDEAITYYASIRSWSQSQWDQIPGRLQLGMMTAAIFGLITGFFVGTLASTISVSVVTSFGGSLLWLTSSAVFAREMGLSENLFASLPAPAWLTLWALLAVIGLSIQWTFRPGRADKQA